jgi:arginyl-tRNA synthetase
MSATLESLRTQLAASLRDAVREVGGEPPERLALERPPRVEMGDLASPVAFDLAKSLRKAPRVIAGQIAESMRLPAGVQKVQVEGNGYVNFFLERGPFVRALLGDTGKAAPREGKVIVEHTNINPNKAAHIGHLRNAVLGDVLIRALRFLGHTVEIQNYLDDTGVQVADVVAALIHMAGVGTEAAVREVIRTAALPGRDPDPKGFAYVCWDLYAEVGRTYEARPETRAWRTEILHAIEEGRNETARIAAAVAEATSSAHLSTMGRIGVVYDLLPRESDILQKNFWARAFEMLRNAGAVHLETEGKNAGCWVLRLSDSEEFAGMEEPDKILVRSNGIITYTAKDIAYQLWKFGLLGIDFDYKRFTPNWNSGAVAENEIPAEVRAHPIWRTSHDGRDPDAPAFGRATEVVNVIDARQSYPQKVVREGLRVLGFRQQADRSAHFAYAFVALSPKAARALSERFGDEYRLSAEDEKKPFVEMSGRKGLGVKADDLIEILNDRARAEVAQRRSEPDEAGAEQDAKAIAVGALRYFLLKFGRNKVIAFDFDEALNFEGDTGPYLQYSAVRADNIFRKLAERQIPEVSPEPDAVWEDDLWEIILMSASWAEVVERAVASLELSTIARHTFSLAQAFNQFYHRHPIVSEDDADLRNRRLASARIFRREISRLLGLLGIPEPQRM